MVGKVEAAVDPDAVFGHGHVVLGLGGPLASRGDPLSLGVALAVGGWREVVAVVVVPLRSVGAA